MNRTKPTRSARVALNLVPLEDRTVPAGNVTAFVVDNVLHVFGDEADNQIYIGPVGRRGAFISSFDGTTTINGQLGNVTFSNVRGGLNIRMGGGDDVVGIVGVKPRGSVTIDMGSGDDALVINDVVSKRGTFISMGDGDDILVGVESKFRRSTVIDMGSGNDVVNLSFSKLGKDTLINGGPGSNVIGLSRMTYRRPATILNFEGQFATLAPKANNDRLLVGQGSSATIAVTANDFGIQGAILPSTISIVQGPSRGVATVNAEGTVTYQHDGSDSTEDTFTYQVRDSLGAFSNPATVRVSIVPGLTTPPPAENRPPVANPDSFLTRINTNLTIDAPGVLLNDSDPDGDTLTVNARTITTAQSGTAVLGADGRFSYTPANDFVGSDTFEYTISDGRGGTATGTVTITVGSSTPDLVANADSFSTPFETPLTVAAASGVLANDTAAQGATLTATVIDGTTNGTLSFNSDGSFTYTPAGGFSGTDSFTYSVNDGLGGTAIGTATITVGVPVTTTPPVATPDSANVNEGAVVVINVAANDTAPGGSLDLTSLAITQQPSFGTAVANSDGTITYTHDGSETLADSFEYTIRNTVGLISAPTLVTITINPVNDAPILTAPPAQSTLVNTPLTFSPENSNAVSVADSDVGANDLQVILSSVNGTMNLTNVGALTLISGNNSDTVVIQGNLFALNAALNGMTFQPAANTAGEAQLTITANDLGNTGSGGPASSSTVIGITIINRPPVANPDEYQTDEDLPLTVDADSGVLANDTDPDNDPITATAGTIATMQGGNVLMAEDGSFVYTPPPNFFGQDTFTYTVNDINGGSAIGIVTITLNPVPDDPTAVADFFSTVHGTPLEENVLTNDFDVDNQPVSNEGLIVTTTGTIPTSQGGSVVLNEDGSFLYTPPDNFIGQDTFEYTISDPTDRTATALVTITVTNTSPIANADSYSTEENTILTVSAEEGVLANDSDPDGDPITATADTIPTTQGGTVEMAADGSFVYTPAQNFFGIDTFEYIITDQFGAAGTATVTIEVIGIPSDPVALPDTFSTSHNAPVSGNVLANDFDPDNQPVSNAGLVVTTAGTFTTANGGTVDLSANGMFTYTPLPTFLGDDQFEYTITDPTDRTATTTVTITVTNAAPVAEPDEYTVDEDNVLTVDAAEGVLANDFDPDNANDPATPDTFEVTAETITTQQGGTVVIAADGSFVYTPVANFYGTDQFEYTVTDNLGASSVGTVTLIVNPIPDDPVAVDDNFETTLDQELTGNVLDNDFDVDNIPPSNVGLEVVTDTLITTEGGNVVLSTDGNFLYTPPLGFAGTDTFLYTIVDESGRTSSATVIIEVLAPS